MDWQYKNKVTVVSGGASGIGAALVSELASQRAIVEILDLDHENPTDISDHDAVASAIADISGRHGRIDVVFSNAGMLKAGDTESFSIEDFDRIIAVNLRGSFLLARSVIPHLKRSHGAMVFTASTSAILGSAGEAAYAASKAGITGLARSLAAELAPSGIRVNVVAPGWIDTPFNDPVWAHAGDRNEAVETVVRDVALRRQGEPGEMVATMLMLGSPAASYLTGQVIAVDGGLSTLR